jgi:Leucine carboxyl methyltransferase
MAKKRIVRPDSTAVRVALWRGLHLEVDPPPHLFEDKIGLELADPKKGWRNRPDMKGPAVTRYRAGIVIRARFVEDLVAEQAERGISQYVILGAGLDTFAQRRPDKQWEYQKSDNVGPQIVKAGTSEVVLDLSDALPCDKNGLNTTQEAERRKNRVGNSYGSLVAFLSKPRWV